jgi:ABC-type lipoprotein export system ATPase subunit
VMRALIEAVKEGGTTLVVVTHNPLVAKGLDRQVVMRDGLIEASSR